MLYNFSFIHSIIHCILKNASVKINEFLNCELPDL